MNHQSILLLKPEGFRWR